MKQKDREGIRPVYREKEFKRVERKKAKKDKKHSWSTNGGYTAPIMVPSTPNGELARILREVVENEQQEGIKFKIVETGGITVKSRLQKSNPTATPGCSANDCVPCRGGRGEGGNCRKSNVQYSMLCGLCPEGQETEYIGETSRNLYTRASEHFQNFKAKKPDNWILQHQTEEHPGQEADFSAKVTHSFRDCLSRQVSEAVHI